MKSTKDRPLSFKSETELKEFERRMREAHQQLPETGTKKAPPQAPSWLHKRAPGIGRTLERTLLPPNPRRKKRNQ